MEKSLLNFLNYEKEKKLFERKYKGINYWQTLRLEFELLVMNYRKMENVPHIKNRNKKELLALCKDFLGDIWNYFFLEKCDILYFDQQNYRNIKGKMADPYFDFFQYTSKWKVQRCFYLHKGKVSDYRRRGIGTVQARIYKQLLFLKMHILPKKYVDKLEERFICELCKDFNARYDLNVSANNIIKKVRRIYLIHETYEKYYRKLLKKVEPKVIFIVCHYDEILFPLYKVAKDLKIPVVEFQHGQICNHYSYNYLDLNEKGKELPDYFFVYGDFWKRYIQLPSSMKVIAVGNPFLEAMKKIYSNTECDKKKIIFYSQRYLEGGKELEKLAVDFCEKYEKEGYRIYIKFHPSEASTWRDKYVLLNTCKKIQTIEGDKNIYELLAGAGHHVCISSTVLYEATNYDVGRYVYNIGSAVGEALMKPLVENGMAQEFFNVEELRQILNDNYSRREELTREIWKQNAKINGQTVLQEIMDAG